MDPGGFFSDSKNLEVAIRWLKKSPGLDGVLFFKEADSLSVDKKEKLCLLLRKDIKDEKTYQFSGSSIKESLKKIDLDWNKLELGTFYSAAQTESADVLQKPGTKAFVFVGNLLTRSHLEQTLLRMRGFYPKK